MEMMLLSVIQYSGSDHHSVWYVVVSHERVELMMIMMMMMMMMMVQISAEVRMKRTQGRVSLVSGYLFFLRMSHLCLRHEEL